MTNHIVLFEPLMPANTAILPELVPEPTRF